MGRQRGAVVDVVHPFQLRALPGIDLQDHPVGLVEPGRAVAHRGRRDQLSVFQDADHFNQRDVELAQESEPDELGHVAEVDVEVFHRAGVDPPAAGGVRLVGEPQFDPLGRRQGAVQLGGRGGPGPDADLELPPGPVRLRDAAGQGLGHGLGVAGPGEAAHADVDARRD